MPTRRTLLKNAAGATAGIGCCLALAPGLISPVDRGRSPKAADRSDRHSETRIALTAAAHVMPAQKCEVYADLDTFTEHKIDPVLGGMEVKNGMVTLPDGPGLGVDVAPAFLKTLHAA